MCWGERWFDTEINSEKIENLLRDLTRNFLTRFLKSRRVRKAGPACLCELYITLYKTMQWRRWIKIDELLIILFTIQNCTCEPFICKKKCYNLDHQRLPILDGQREHCILYSCNACAIRENLEEICDKSNTKPEGIDNIFCTLNKFFTLLHWGFIQPHKEKYDSLNNHLNFSLSGVAICRCTWV